MPHIFYTYIACRYTSVIQASYHAIRNTISFDRAEKDARHPGNTHKRRGDTPSHITFLHFKEDGNVPYADYSAIVSSVYPFYGVLSLTSLVALETMLCGLDVRPSSGIDSMSQVIPLVLASTAISRVCHILKKLFKDGSDGDTRFQWPFHLRQTHSAHRWIEVACKVQPKNSLCLGSLPKNSRDIEDIYEVFFEVPRELEKSKRKENVVLVDSWSDLPLLKFRWPLGTSG